MNYVVRGNIVDEIRKVPVVNAVVSVTIDGEKSPKSVKTDTKGAYQVLW